MLKIRQEQMAAFAEPLEAQFLERIRAFLHERAPELAAQAGDDLDVLAARGRRDAAALGCATEQEIVLFIVLSLLHGGDFTEREPWASVIAKHRAANRSSGLATALMDASVRSAAGR